MLTMDVFKQDAFSAVEMLTAIDKVGYTPGFLGSLPGLFDPVPIRTKTVYVESRGTDAALIQTSQRGEALAEKVDGKRDVRPFNTYRLAKKSRIEASELFAIRAFGSETELKQLASEVTRRQFLLKQDMDTTFENWRLACIQGKLLDADGTTLKDWATEFGQTIPAEVDFDLDNANPAAGAVRKKCYAAIRSMTTGLKGLGGNAMQIWAVCGDNFWDDLVSHPEVEKTYLNTQAAADLRNGFGSPWQTFRYGGINFTNYKGTDDGSTVAVGTDKAKFFPTGAGIFKWVMSPGESFEHLGALGQNFYSLIVPDNDRNQYADIEMYSYPLAVCTMPQALYQAKRT